MGIKILECIVAVFLTTLFFNLTNGHGQVGQLLDYALAVTIRGIIITYESTIDPYHDHDKWP